MSQIITYNLKAEGSSINFYKELSIFTFQIIEEANIFFENFLADYKDYISKHSLEKLRSNEEYIFDLLLTGLLWDNYHFNALKSELLFTLLHKKLYNMRRKYKSAKKWIDNIRCILATKFLEHSSNSEQTEVFNTPHFKRLIRWLAATGEYQEEVERLKLLCTWIEQLPESISIRYLSEIHAFAKLFTKQSETVLGKYTFNANAFIENNLEKYKERKDYIFCGKKQVEYHLNMVGSELMNISFSRDFHSTEEKALLLPECMRLHLNDSCKAKQAGLDKICSDCSSDCNVYKYKKLGEELGFTVHIIPHSNDFSCWLESFAAGKNVGVIGVTCILNLIQGGLELKKLNVPAQCVFLDYCSCNTHRNKNGFSTDICKEKLISILNIR